MSFFHHWQKTPQNQKQPSLRYPVGHWLSSSTLVPIPFLLTLLCFLCLILYISPIPSLLIENKATISVSCSWCRCAPGGQWVHFTSPGLRLWNLIVRLSWWSWGHPWPWQLAPLLGRFLNIPCPCSHLGLPFCGQQLQPCTSAVLHQIAGPRQHYGSLVTSWWFS